MQTSEQLSRSPQPPAVVGDRGHGSHSHPGSAHTLQDTLLIVVGVLLAGMGLKGFLAASQFIDGGVTGVSMLLAKVAPFPLAVWLLVLNLPFVVLGYRMVGRTFALRSAVAISGLSVSLGLLPYPVVTTDKLLTAVFGGLCLGAGIGLAIRGGAVLDGTEVAALLISRGTHLFRVGDVILAINVVIFGAAALLLGTEPAMYSLLTYISATKSIDFLLHGIEEYTAIVITSPRGNEIRQAIVNGLQRGVTVYAGRGGHSGEEQAIIHCVVTRLEIGAVKDTVKEVDPSAFIVMYPLSDVEGGVMRRRRVH